jgi:hypothetical protein
MRGHPFLTSPHCRHGCQLHSVRARHHATRGHATHPRIPRWRERRRCRGRGSPALWYLRWGLAGGRTGALRERPVALCPWATAASRGQFSVPPRALPLLRRRRRSRACIGVTCVLVDDTQGLAVLGLLLLVSSCDLTVSAVIEVSMMAVEAILALLGESAAAVDIKRHA